MKLTRSEKNEFYSIIDEILLNQEVLKMKNFMQHGSTDTFSHCFSVAINSFYFAKKFKIKISKKSLIMGAMLHDFYLYDWHDEPNGRKKHGFYHPQVALENANEYFEIDDIVSDVISKHMWPLTVRKIPRHKESVIVCLVDKGCAFMEMSRAVRNKVSNIFSFL